MTSERTDFKKLKKIVKYALAALILMFLCTVYIGYYLIFKSSNAGMVQYLIIGIGMLLLVALSAAMVYLGKSIFLSLKHLYKGIDDLGLGFYSLPSKKNTGDILPMSTEIDEMFEKIKNIISLISNLSDNTSFTETLQYIYNSFLHFIPYNYIGISLISEDKRYIQASYGIGDSNIKGLPEKFRGMHWPIKETSLWELVKTGNARIINDLEEYCEGKPQKSYNKAILEAGVRASITLPLKVNGEPVGLIFFSSARKNVYKPEHIKLLQTLASSIAISLNQNKYVNDIIYSSILALAKLAEARDGFTGEHINRISLYSRLIAELLYENNLYTDEINLDYIEQIERYSPLHDIGKVGIRDSILLKPGRLTAEEYEEMKLHAVYGAEVLRQAEKNMKNNKSMFHMGVEISEGHHEKWDGSGYPYGKKGKEIPLCARIVAVADVFDALTSARPYKPAYSFENSMKMISEGKGSHFDPVIVDVFLANSARVKSLHKKFSNVMSEEEKIG